MYVLTVAISLLLTGVVVRCDDQPCTIPSGKSSCVCDTGSGIIDLTSLGKTDNTPNFVDYDSSQQNQYFYNPCHSFSQGFSECSYGDVSVCQDYGSDEANCGTTATEQIVQRDGGDYYVLYDSGTDGRSSEVHLICDQSADTPFFQPYGDYSTLKYEFDLTTKCACPGGCDDSTPPTDPDDPTDPTDPNHPTDHNEPSSIAAGEIGIVLMVMFPLALLTYFIVGAILLKFKFQKTGTEIIPQKNFWFALPFLVKDGCLFTFKPLIGLVKKDKVAYDSI